MATIKDIAMHAKVSTATVSRVINEKSSVAPDLRDAVLAAMKELNYYPNSIARSLKKESSMTIGLVMLEPENAHIISLCSAIEQAVSPSGYLPFFYFTNGNPDLERNILSHMISRKVDGIIISTCGLLHDYIAKISHMLPVAAVYRSIDHPDFTGDYIDSNVDMEIYQITKHLLENGHRRIFALNGPQHVSSGYKRFGGFKRAMAEYGILVDDSYPYRYDSDYTAKGGYEGCRRLFSMPDRATALVAGNVQVLLGTLSYCQEHNVGIPGDISVVCGMQPENSTLFFTDITSAVLDAKMIGKRAGQMILERIANADVKLKNQVIFSSKIHYGNSVKRLP